MNKLLLPVYVILFLLICASIGFSASRVFDLKYRPASEVAETVREILEPGSKVVAVDHALLVEASSEELDLVETLIERMDQKPHMLRVFVDQGRSDQQETSVVGGSGRFESGSTQIRIGRDHVPADRGVGNVIIDGEHGHVNLSAQQQSLRQSRQVSQYLVVLEGHPARIVVGQSVPFTAQLRSACRRHGYLIENIEYQNIDTGFEVVPDLYGKQVHLVIRPFMAFLDSSSPREIVFQELATQVRIPVGTWYDLAGSELRQNDLIREILASGHQGRGVESLIRVKVDIQN